MMLLVCESKNDVLVAVFVASFHVVIVCACAFAAMPRVWKSCPPSDETRRARLKMLVWTINGYLSSPQVLV
jgi:hypothetical protein